MSHSVRTIQQLLREFWLPLLVAMAWTIYAVWGKPLDLKTIVSVLGPAFFLASWMTGHFFRVRKQENVQTGLTSLEGRLEGLVGQLESQAKEITQFTTGGDSYCYFSIGVGDNSNQSTWTVVHEGKLGRPPLPHHSLGCRLGAILPRLLALPRGTADASFPHFQHFVQNG